MPFTALGFTENWLNASNYELYNIPGYTHECLYRKNMKGGGVSLFISDILNFKAAPWNETFSIVSALKIYLR